MRRRDDDATDERIRGETLDTLTRRQLAILEHLPAYQAAGERTASLQGGLPGEPYYCRVSTLEILEARGLVEREEVWSADDGFPDLAGIRWAAA